MTTNVKSPNVRIQERIKRFKKSKNPKDIATLNKVVKEYKEKLAKQYRHAFEDVMEIDAKKCNTIELSVNKKYDLHKISNWLITMPCFAKGLLILPDDESIFWRLLDMNIEGRSATLDLFYKVKGVYVIRCKSFISFDVKNAPNRILAYGDSITTDEICNYINMTQYANWNKTDNDTWQESQQITHHLPEYKQISDVTFKFLSAMHYANSVMKQDAQQNNTGINTNASTNSIESLLTVFTSDFKIDNEGRQVIVYNKHCKVKTTQGKPYTYVNDDLFIKHIEYTMPNWQVRGYMRHCKGGKTVYVHPHIRTRSSITQAKIDSKPPKLKDIKIK